MSLLIAAQPYEVIGASLFASVIDPKHAHADCSAQVGLFWRLEVNTREGISFWQDDIQLPNIRRWTDLIGQTISWNGYSDQNADVGWYGAGLLCTNSEILQGELCFTERSECQFHVRWMGTVSTAPLGSGSTSREQLHFEIDCWCVFVGVSVLSVNKIGESAKRELIAQFLDIADFSEPFVNTSYYAPDSMPMLTPLC